MHNQMHDQTCQLDLQACDELQLHRMPYQAQQIMAAQGYVCLNQHSQDQRLLTKNPLGATAGQHLCGNLQLQYQASCCCLQSMSGSQYQSSSSCFTLNTACRQNLPSSHAWVSQHCSRLGSNVCQLSLPTHNDQHAEEVLGPSQIADCVC